MSKMPFEAAVVCTRATARMIWPRAMFAINIALGMIIFSVVPVVGFCECGYTTTISTGVSTQLFTFTDVLELDALHLKDVEIDTDWSIQNYQVSAADARGPYG
jgi:hypothetical protein